MLQKGLKGKSAAAKESQGGAFLKLLNQGIEPRAATCAEDE